MCPACCYSRRASLRPVRWMSDRKFAKDSAGLQRLRYLRDGFGRALCRVLEFSGPESVKRHCRWLLLQGSVAETAARRRHRPGEDESKPGRTLQLQSPEID